MLAWKTDNNSHINLSAMSLLMTLNDLEISLSYVHDRYMDKPYTRFTVWEHQILQLFLVLIYSFFSRFMISSMSYGPWRLYAYCIGL